MTFASATLPRSRGHDAATTPDRALMVHVAAGDTEAFDELYRRHNRRVLAHARTLCASRELAEEVAQEAFVSLWRGAHLYRPERGSVGAWLSGMVRNRAIDAWRRAAIRPVEVEALEEGSAQLQSADTWSPDRAAMLALISGLPADQREAVFLAYFGDMTHAEIAAGADLPLGTVKGRIRLGLEKLRSGFADQVRAQRAQPAWPALRPAPPPAVEREPARRTRAECMRRGAGRHPAAMPEVQRRSPG
jgi:RNA polymerase sigma-70 factor (ECF subfamily)